jgi:hypothetical protein
MGGRKTPTRRPGAPQQLGTVGPLRRVCESAVGMLKCVRIGIQKPRAYNQYVVTETPSHRCQHLSNAEDVGGVGPRGCQRRRIWKRREVTLVRST